MTVEILACDSLGARSMATCVMAGGHIFVIDPGVALGPKRYGLSPHRLELVVKDRLWERIENVARKARFMIITHYHHDHYNPARPDVFYDKIVFIKDPERNINKSQRARASLLLEQIKGRAREIIVADGKEFNIDGVRISFSPAQPHGFTNRLGYVLQVLFEYGGKRFLYTSDIQGAPLDEHFQFIVDAMPSIILMDGPATYLYPVRFSPKALEASLKHMALIQEKVKPEYFIVDHHTTRDEKFNRWFSGINTTTAARFMKREDLFLEAWRKRLYRNEIGLSPDQIQQV